MKYRSSFVNRKSVHRHRLEEEEGDEAEERVRRPPRLVIRRPQGIVGKGTRG